MRGLDQRQRRSGIVAREIQQAEPVQRLHRVAGEQGTVSSFRCSQVVHQMRGTGFLKGREHDDCIVPGNH